MALAARGVSFCWSSSSNWLHMDLQRRVLCLTHEYSKVRMGPEVRLVNQRHSSTDLKKRALFDATITGCAHR